MSRHAHGARFNIVQGEYKVSDDPDVVLTTLLGSCVAACIRDPVKGIGGMNHFLLPGGDVGSSRDSERIGVHLMELLLNGLMRQGAQRERLEAKLFGGARMMQGLSDIGAKNAAFAKTFPAVRGHQGRSAATPAAIRGGASSSGRDRAARCRATSLRSSSRRRRRARRRAPSPATSICFETV